MKLLPLLAVPLLLFGYPAAACLPPPPGSPEPAPPTEADRVEGIFVWATDIVYGVVTRGSWSGEEPRFKVIHVYKGSQSPGRTLGVRQGWSFNPPPCPGMAQPPPIDNGEYGVIAYNGTPELNFLSDERLELMFKAGWIKRATKR